MNSNPEVLMTVYNIQIRYTNTVFFSWASSIV